MKIYLAGRFDERDKIRQLQERLRERGHVITADWTTHDPIARYDERLQLSADYAKEDLDGVAVADAFIFITAPTVGTGTHTELGVAIHQQQLTGRPQVYVVGDHNNRSVMYYHPAVRRRGSFDEVLDELEAVG